jgi:hypothetical protein
VQVVPVLVTEDSIYLGSRSNSAFLLFWQKAGPAPPVTAATPSAGGSVPGFVPEALGTGMGPYKRPGQVFGEPDPVSPYLSSRAPVAPVRTQAPLTPLRVETVQDVDELAIALLIAFEATVRH